MKKIITVLILLFNIVINTYAQNTAKIYGGKHYDQFLGCMDCDGESPNSIWSPFTTYGSSYDPKSIWNELGRYGLLKSNFSPYNPEAKYPPRVVDANGKILGHLTVNKNNPERFKGMVADLICFKRDMVLKDGVEKYAEIFTKKN